MNYIQKLLSNSKDVSFGRVGSCIIGTVWLLLCAFLTLTTSKAVDIPTGWAYLVAALFGIAKGGDVTTEIAISRIKVNPPIPVKDEEDA